MAQKYNNENLVNEIKEINLIWGDDITSPKAVSKKVSRPAPSKPVRSTLKAASGGSSSGRSSSGRSSSRRNSSGSSQRLQNKPGKTVRIAEFDEYQKARRPKSPERVHNNRRAQAMLKKKKRRQQVLIRRMAAASAVILIAFSALVLYQQVKDRAPKKEDKKAQVVNNDNVKKASGEEEVQGLPAAVYGSHPSWKEDFLTVNENSRPGDPLTDVKSIFVHYTANPRTSAAQNRSYFENLKDTKEASVSSHFIIGYEGEIIQCVPLDEIAYAVQTRNMDSISIECCYISPDGSFTDETYESLISLLRWLVTAYDLDEEDILRHYDSRKNEKKCPIYYVENEDEWAQLKKDVKAGRL